MDAPEAVSIDALPSDVRRLVADTSERRAALELKGAAAFTRVTQALVDVGADTAIVELAAHAIGQELEHSQIYLDLARAYRGAEVARPVVGPIDAPHFRAAPEGLRPILQVIAMCSVNETMACGFLELCLRGATMPAVRAGIRRVLADEIHHARIGWALLGSRSIGDAERREIARWVQAMLEIHLTGWQAQIATLPEGAAPEHGCPGGAAIEKAAMESIRAIVLPGFAAAGIEVEPARHWFSSLVG